MEEGGIRSYLIGGTRFDLPSTYTPSRYVNQGAYGVVWFVLRDLNFFARNGG